MVLAQIHAGFLVDALVGVARLCWKAVSGIACRLWVTWFFTAHPPSRAAAMVIIKTRFMGLLAVDGRCKDAARPAHRDT